MTVACCNPKDSIQIIGISILSQEFRRDYILLREVGKIIKVAEVLPQGCDLTPVLRFFYLTFPAIIENNFIESFFIDDLYMPFINID